MPTRLQSPDMGATLFSTSFSKKMDDPSNYELSEVINSYSISQKDKFTAIILFLATTCSTSCGIA